jgi:hypothetical protein
MTADVHELLVNRAEQAVLGAVLLRPEVFWDIAYLDRSHFADTSHADLFDAIRATLAQDASQSSADLESRLRADGSTADLEALMEACPGPDGAAAYARMLVEADLDRTMASHAERLRRGSEPESQQRAEATVLDHSAPETPAAAEEAPIPGGWKGSQPNREERILADLVQHPGVFDHLPVSLKPYSFSADARSTLYQALREIRDRGDVVDRLTLAWELDRLQRDALHLESGVDPVACIDRLAALPVELGTSVRLADELAAISRRTGEHARVAERAAPAGHGPRAQERAIGREIGRHQTPEREYRPRPASRLRRASIARGMARVSADGLTGSRSRSFQGWRLGLDLPN